MAAADSGAEKTIALVSSDNTRFEAPEAAALLSQTVRRMIDEAGGSAGGDGIRLPVVDARTLSKVLEYCNKHAPAPAPASSSAPSAEDLESFDREFVHVDMGTLHSLAKAAQYLKVQGLVDLVCQTVAGMIRGKTTVEMRQILRIQSDFTPEEEDELRRESIWRQGKVKRSRSSSTLLTNC